MAGFMKWLLISLFVVLGSAQAQTNDPTRPPAAWLAPSADTPASAGEGGGMRLQSVLLPHGGKPVAVIGGKTVTLGGQIAGAKLVRLNEREAVLQGADGVTHLYLTPDVEKQMIVARGSRPQGMRGTVKGLP